MDQELYPHAVLLVEDLSLRLGGHLIFEDVSFVVDEGEIAIIIGPNGAGKTMLMRTILNLIPAQTGRVTILGHDHRDLGDASRRIGYMPQRLDFDRTFPITVFEVMLLRLERSGFWLHRARLRERVRAALARVHAEKLIDRPIGRLSGGELQRVLLAYALLTSPELLLLDEPAAGVDVAGEDTFYEIIHALKREQNLTVVMVSHDLDVVFKYADQVLCLNRRLLCRGAPRAVLQPEVLEQTYGALASSYHHHHAH
ncbi:MAG: metal ABC transporter ATP-binding protein [Actinobacteria bacterium]|nr:metal ABC transporter ATP-binding protein [Actinomycetota bacterium]